MAEAYMNSRIMRNLRVKSSIARYLGEFVADRSDGGFIQGTQWLIWKFESDTTLADAMQASACMHAASRHTQPAGYGANAPIDGRNCDTALADAMQASALHSQPPRMLGLFVSKCNK